MRLDLWPAFARPFARGRWLVLGVLAVLTVAGCGRQQSAEVVQAARPLTVRVTRPEVRDIVRFVGQPSFVESYERTSIYPKLSAYIKKWYVDIGDKVTKQQVLADLFVPEVEEDCQTKHEALELAEERVKLAQEQVKVSDANLQVAAAHLDAARRILDQYESQVARWDKEVNRLTRETKGGHVDARVLRESQSQLASSAAARDAALAEIERSEADLKSKKASLEQDEVAVEVAQADVEVARHDYLRVKALVDWYLKLYAPYDGVIVARNANTWDFVLPATGDPTADHERTPNLSPSGGAAPVYVVDRTDVVRVFIDIPEGDANFVRVGSKATVLAKAFRDQPIVGAVTRTSSALNMKSRTLRAEIDLPNTRSRIPNDLPPSTREALTRVRMPPADTEILPGMYAYGKVVIERPQVRALPVAALMHDGDQTFYFGYDNGKAVQTEIQTGVGDGKWIEVTSRKRRPMVGPGVRNVNYTPTSQVAGEASAALGEEEDWIPLDGSEQVIVGDLSILTDGVSVEVGPATPDGEVASGPSSPGEGGNDLELATDTAPPSPLSLEEG